MSDTLSNKEIDKLVKLGGDIQQDLSCDANGTGLPCRTDRLEAIKNMKRQIILFIAYPRFFYFFRLCSINEFNYFFN